MNERIQELAEQAREKKFDYRAREGESHYIYVLNEEKFAELIVKECIEYCGENLSKTVGGALKIHFGVEESGIDHQLRNRSTYFGNNP